MPRQRNLNVNLLVTFDAIMKERHVSRAASKIGVSQPALSYDLRKLRRLFNDVLFIRGPSGFEPTARAIEIHESVRSALVQIQSVVAGCDAFDPTTAHRSFGVAMTDAVTFELMPPLVRQLRQLAPKVHLRVENAGTEDSCALLLSGMVDLAIVTKVKLPPGIVGGRFFATPWFASQIGTITRYDMDDFRAMPSPGLHTYSSRPIAASAHMRAPCFESVGSS